MSAELNALADRFEKLGNSPKFDHAEEQMTALQDAAEKIDKAFSGSWLGYHAYVYYEDLKPPPPGAHFSQEWGMKDTFATIGSRGNWVEWDPDKVVATIKARAGNPDLTDVKLWVEKLKTEFSILAGDVISILRTTQPSGSDSYLDRLIDEFERLEPGTEQNMIDVWRPSGQIMTRDAIAAGQGTWTPPHYTVFAEVAAISLAKHVCEQAAKICRQAASHISRKSRTSMRDDRIGTNVFIGHGRSAMWRELKDFVQDRLRLPWDEFNRVPVAGVTNQARLSEMLDASAIALIVMTAEDETAEGKVQARMNVIHEVGLFQGRLGFTKAIVLLEAGCEEFSNITGIGQIRFPAGNISACFEEVRKVAEREGLVPEES